MFWPFKKKHPQSLFRCHYVLAAKVNLTDQKAVIDLNNMQTAYIEADDPIDAQKKLASRVMMSPHVYIHRITKVASLTTTA